MKAKSSQRSKVQRNELHNGYFLTKLGKKSTAVAGLMWQPLMDYTHQEQEIKKAKRVEKCEFHVLNSEGNRAQFGLAAQLPVNQDYYSAAMMAARIIGSSWLGLFQLDEFHYWLVGIDNALIVPGCDTVFSDYDKALEQFNLFKPMFSWEAFYRSESLAIEGEARDVLDFLNDAAVSKSSALAHKQKYRHKAKGLTSRMIALTVVAVLAYSGIGYYHKIQEDKRQAIVKAQMLKKKLAAKNKDDIWRKQPPAFTKISGCFSAVRTLPLQIAGWDLDNVVCRGSQVSGNYKSNKNATTKNFLQVAEKMFPEKFTLGKGMTAQIVLPLEFNGDRKSEQLKPIKEAAEDIIELYQLGMVKGKIDDVYAKEKNPIQFNMNTEYLPEILFKDRSLSGVVIQEVSVKVDASKLEWNIKGDVYGR